MKFKSPFTCIVSGGTGSGKTEWVKRLIHHRRHMINPPPRYVLFCYGELNNSILELKGWEGVETFHGFPPEEMLRKHPDMLLVLDDLMVDLDKNLRVMNTVFTRGSHHWRVSVIFIAQNIFHKDLRMLKSNTHLIVLMRNPQNASQIRTLASQMFPIKRAFFIEAYEDATSSPFSYLLVDSHPQTPDTERLTTKIFPGEKQIYYVPI
jgi:hypothetical protein